MVMHIPPRLLPLAIRLVRAGRKALWRVGDALAEAERDLLSMVEPTSVDDLVRPRVCVDCGTSEERGMCDSCAVLGTGRLPS